MTVRQVQDHFEKVFSFLWSRIFIESGAKKVYFQQEVSGVAVTDEITSSIDGMIYEVSRTNVLPVESNNSFIVCFTFFQVIVFVPNDIML